MAYLDDPRFLPTDPQVIDQWRVREPEPEPELEPAPEDDIDFAAQWAEIQPLLDRIPPMEADIVELVTQGVREESIANLFSLTQPAISYRLIAAKHRLRLLLIYPGRDLTAEDVSRDLGAHLNQDDLDIVRELYATTCVSEVARRLGQTQGRVLYRLRWIVERLATREWDAATERHVQTLRFLREHPHFLWSPRQEHWTARAKREGRPIRKPR